MTASPAELLAQFYAPEAAAVRSLRRRSGEPIARIFAETLTQVVRDNAAMTVVEVGMAYGASTLAILAGLPAGGRLISIDPFQADFDFGGRDMVASCSRAADHRLVEQPDYIALPALLEEEVVADLVYIDGMHTFDYVALDAFYADKLLRVGGIVAFNDCGFRSVHKFLGFSRVHRHYAELDVGLPANFQGANPLISLHRMLTGRSNQDRYFRKLDDWEPQLNFFKPF